MFGIITANMALLIITFLVKCWFMNHKKNKRKLKFVMLVVKIIGLIITIASLGFGYDIIKNSYYRAVGCEKKFGIIDEF